MNEIPSPLATVLNLPTPLEKIDLGRNTPRIWCKRDDLIHPIISGNKWRKLSCSITKLVSTNKPKSQIEIISFGGGHSNHLHALAYICHVLGYAFTAIVRGHYEGNETPCLQDLVAWSANIVYVDKIQYKHYTDASQIEHQTSLARLQASYPNAVIIPEGGYSIDALAGSETCLAEIAQQVSERCAKQTLPPPTKTVVVTPVATGATLAGLFSAGRFDILGIAVLKGVGYLEQNINDLLGLKPQRGSESTWQINHDFVTRGYAKSSAELDAFISTWNQANPALQVEPCYSGKALWGLVELLKSGSLQDYSDIIFLHTGGLQGARNKNTL